LEGLGPKRASLGTIGLPMGSKYKSSGYPERHAGHRFAKGYFSSFMQIETSKLFQIWAVQKNTSAKEDVS
jgi:hypothetical protein